MHKNNEKGKKQQKNSLNNRKISRFTSFQVDDLLNFLKIILLLIREKSSISKPFNKSCSSVELQLRAKITQANYKNDGVDFFTIEVILYDIIRKIVFYAASEKGWCEVTSQNFKTNYNRE